MGSKLNKLIGFSADLEDIRDKFYVIRDGISERTRKAGMDGCVVPPGLGGGRSLSVFSSQSCFVRSVPD